MTETKLDFIHVENGDHFFYRNICDKSIVSHGRNEKP